MPQNLERRLLESHNLKVISDSSFKHLFYTRAMKLLLARVVLVLLLLSFAGSRAQDTDLLENPIWTADGQAAVTLILEYARGFDPLSETLT